MNNNQGFKDLRVWKQGIVLAEQIYSLTSKLPTHERFGLIDQLRRSAISIPSNIAEGQKRLNRQETVQFCGIALGSSAELQTQLILASRLYKLPVEKELGECEEISKMLTGLIKAIKNKS